MSNRYSSSSFFIVRVRSEGVAYLGKSHAEVLKQFAKVELVIVADLYHHSRVLCEESLHHVTVVDVVKINVHSTLGVGKTHLKQSGNQSAGAYIVARHYPSAANELLYGVETCLEVFSIEHGWDVVAYVADALSKCRSSQSLGAEREVDVVK